jgi:hypothetical protein
VVHPPRPRRVIIEAGIPGKVSPAATISRMNRQMSGQSCAPAARMIRPSRAGARGLSRWVTAPPSCSATHPGVHRSHLVIAAGHVDDEETTSIGQEEAKMSVMMLRAKVKPESVDEVEAAVTRMFSAIGEAQPEGVRYASCRLGHEATFVILLQYADGIENPLSGVTEFKEFQANLRNWLAEPPVPEQLTVGSYNLF